MIGVCVCGGSGQRLGPLGRVVHKSLLPCNDRTFLEVAIDRCVFLGCEEVLVVVDHLGDQVREFLSDDRVADRIRADVRVRTLRVRSTSEAIDLVSDDLTDEFAYTHGNIDVDSADLALLADVSLDAGRSGAFLIGPSRIAPTHPRVAVSDEYVTSFVEAGGTASLCSVGVARVRRDLALSAAVGTYPFELGLNRAISEGASVLGVQCSSRWWHLESMRFFERCEGRFQDAD